MHACMWVERTNRRIEVRAWANLMILFVPDWT